VKHATATARREPKPARTTATGTSGLSAADQARLKDLAALSGQRFDQAYVNDVVTSQQQALQLVNGAMGGAQGDYKDFLGRVQPVLQKHLDSAQQLQQRINAGTR
jgi:predicted outer membrane protein